MKKRTSFFWLLTSSAVIIIALFIGSTASAQNLDTVKAAIDERGANWVSGETSITRLTDEEKTLRAGLIMPTEVLTKKLLSVESSRLAAVTALPSYLDLRTSGYVTAVKNQGNCGSCWAFATTGALESYALMNSGASAAINLSEQVLVSCGGAGSCSGGYIDDASDFIRYTGLPTETCYPYLATNGSCTNACANWKLSTEDIATWAWVTTSSPTTTAIKQALATYGPLVTTMRVYGDFFSYKSGVYSQVSGTYRGGHAILIVGYDDANSCFIVKNSWGTGWGESGYFRIAYSQLSSVVQFGYYTIAYQPAAPLPSCTYSISPTTKRFSAVGGTGTITLTASSSTCQWTAASNASWIRITSATSGTGSAAIKYTVSSRSRTVASRTGTLTIAGKTFTVTQ